MDDGQAQLDAALDALEAHHAAAVRGPLATFLGQLEGALLERTRLACIWALGAHRADTRKPGGGHYMHHVLEVAEPLHDAGDPSYARLVNKYRPCIALLRDRREHFRNADHPIARVHERLDDRLEAAWSRRYA